MSSPRRARLLACIGMVALSSFALSIPAHAESSARNKPGPVTIRGVVAEMTSSRFVLQTTTRGTYSVQLAASTKFSEKGHSGSVRPSNGDHVGVRGFVHGRTIVAITVRVYPTKPKPTSIAGSILSAGSGSIRVRTATGTVTAAVNSATSVTVGGAPADLSQLRIGDRVHLRVERVHGRLVAISIRGFKRKIVSHHVRIAGKITSLSPSSLSISAAGRRLNVRISSATAVHVGNSLGSLHQLKAGQNVTIYACCSGAPLVATSIHIHTSRAVAKSVAFRGRIRAVTSGRLVLSTASGSVTVELNAGTQFQVGSHPARSTDLRVGDEALIRVRTDGKANSALLVHVYASSRSAKTISGFVRSISKGTARVQTSSGKFYQIEIPSKVPVVSAKDPSRATKLTVGDRVKIRVQTDAAGRLVATAVAARAATSKIVSVRGVLVSATTNLLEIRGDDGSLIQVHFSASSEPRLHGKPAPKSALFAGARLTVRGKRSAGTITAKSIKLTLITRKATGRVTRLLANEFFMSSKAGRTYDVDLGSNSKVADSGKRVKITALRTGTFVTVSGYEESSSRFRATAVQINHPTVSESGTIVAIAPLRIRTPSGDLYALRLASTSVIEVSRVHLEIPASDVPNGSSVRVQGTVDSAGEIEVSSLTVRLATLNLRGKITDINAARITLDAASKTYSLRLVAGAIIKQGARELALTDIVVGDDVTITGFPVASGVVTTRVLVHRRRVTVDGTVTSVDSGGFVMHTANGDRRVLISSSTSQSSAASIAVGMNAHVRGYLRGDGAILATHVTLTKPRS